MSRSLYAMLHRRFGPTLPDSERCVQIEAKLQELNLQRTKGQGAALSRDCLSKLSDTTVAIVGGGLAGLSAAWSLSPLKVMITIFEAHDEVGGRVRSDTTFTKDRIIEAGAELIGANHPKWLELARHFGLGLNVVTREEDYERAGLEVRTWIDKLLSRDDAKKLYERMENEVLKPFGQDASLINDPAQPWLQSTLAKLDKESVADQLRARNIKKTDLLWRAMEMLLSNNNVVASLADQNYLALLCLISGGKFGNKEPYMGYWRETEVFRCAAGSQALATNMAHELQSKYKCKIQRGTKVTDINLAKRVTLKWENIHGKKQGQGLFDYVILAVPPSVWGNLKITPFDPLKTIGLMQMGPAVKFLSNLSERFWIKQGNAPASWSSMIGQTWEGTDNQTRLGEQGIDLSVFAGGQVHTVAEFKKGLELLYPGYSTKIKPTKLHPDGTKLVDWPNEPFIKTGYASPKPGQVFTVGKELNETFQGRMFFAGEHTAMNFFGYMEGALSSGEHAAHAVIDKVCGRASEFVASRALSAPGTRVLPGSHEGTVFEDENAGEESMAEPTSRGEFTRTDLWRLPDVLSVEASKVRFAKPRLHYTGTRPALSHEAIQILVRTNGPFPVRAWSPAIFVGEIAILEYETVQPNVYRFFAYDMAALREGAAISLGWPQFPERKVRTQFVFQLRGTELVS